MGDLSLYDRTRGIVAYENSQSYGPDGSLVTSYRYYEEKVSVGDRASKTLGPMKPLSKVVSQSGPGELPVMVYANSFALFLLTMVFTLKLLLG